MPSLFSLWGRVAWGLGIAMLALIAALSFQLEQTAKARDEEREAKNIALAANEANTATIEALQDRISRDAALLRELRNIRTEITAASDQRRADLDELARADHEIRDFLALPIPTGLRDPQGSNADGADPAGD